MMVADNGIIWNSHTDCVTVLNHPVTYFIEKKTSWLFNALKII